MGVCWGRATTITTSEYIKRIKLQWHKQTMEYTGKILPQESGMGGKRGRGAQQSGRCSLIRGGDQRIPCPREKSKIGR